MSGLAVPDWWTSVRCLTTFQAWLSAPFLQEEGSGQPEFGICCRACRDSAESGVRVRAGRPANAGSGEQEGVMSRFIFLPARRGCNESVRQHRTASPAHCWAWEPLTIITRAAGAITTPQFRCNHSSLQSAYLKLNELYLCSQILQSFTLAQVCENGRQVFD